MDHPGGRSAVVFCRKNDYFCTQKNFEMSLRLHIATIIVFFSAIISFAEAVPERWGSNLDSLSRIPTRTLFGQGEDAFRNSEFDRATEIFVVLCSRYDGTSNKDESAIYARSFNRYGNLLYKRGAYSSAMDNYLKARRIGEDNNDTELLAEVYANIGNVYAANSEFPNAIRFYRRALPLCTAADSSSRLKSMILNNLTSSNLLSEETDSAQLYSQLYEEQGLHDDRYVYDVVLNRGLLDDATGKTDSAIAAFHEAAGISIARNLHPLCLGAAYSFLSKTYERTGVLDSAIKYMHETERISRNANRLHLVAGAWRDLSRLYTATGQHELGLQYKSKYLNLADSINSSQESNKFENSQILYELESSARTIQGLNVEKARQRQLLLVMAIAAAVFIVLSVILYRQKKLQKQAWSELYEKNMHQLENENYYKRRMHELEERIAAMTDTDNADTDSSGQHPSTRKLVVGTEERERIAKEILRVMEESEEICSSDFSIDRLASEIGSNSRYVSEVINEVFEKNFRTLLNEYRVRKAMLRLSDTANYGHFTIKAISESVGYRSQATFISVFTKYTGLKPSIYQKLALEKRVES